MYKIARNQLPCRRGDSVEELAGMLEKYERLIEEHEFDGCPGFQVDLLFNLGCAYEHAGKLEKSIELHQRLIEMNPEDHMALYTAGTNLCKLRRFDEARVLLEKAVKLQPNKPDYRNNLEYAIREGPRIIREKIKGPIC